MQKIGETYDCDAVVGDGASPLNVYNATKYNLVEDNDFAYTPSSATAPATQTPAPFAGIQEAGQSGVIRRNRFYNMLGPGLDLTNYAGEAQYVTGNRVYHNVFYGTGYAGISLSMSDAFDATVAGVVMGTPGPTSYFSDNVLKNNALSMSQVDPSYAPILWTPCYMQLDGKPVQVVAWGAAGFSFQGSDFFGGAGQANDDYLVTYIPGGAPSASSCLMSSLLVPWASGGVTLIDGTNFVSDPQFVDAGGLDFHPASKSPLIDTGVFLTQTVGAGSSTTIVVQDCQLFLRWLRDRGPGGRRDSTARADHDGSSHRGGPGEQHVDRGPAAVLEGGGRDQSPVLGCCAGRRRLRVRTLMREVAAQSAGRAAERVPHLAGAVALHQLFRRDAERLAGKGNHVRRVDRGEAPPDEQRDEHPAARRQRRAGRLAEVDELADEPAFEPAQVGLRRDDDLVAPAAGDPARLVDGGGGARRVGGQEGEGEERRQVEGHGRQRTLSAVTPLLHAPPPDGRLRQLCQRSPEHVVAVLERILRR